jgi:hypothetical protein
MKEGGWEILVTKFNLNLFVSLLYNITPFTIHHFFAILLQASSRKHKNSLSENKTERLWFNFLRRVQTLGPWCTWWLELSLWAVQNI